MIGNECRLTDFGTVHKCYLSPFLQLTPKILLVSINSHSHWNTPIQKGFWVLYLVGVPLQPLWCCNICCMCHNSLNDVSSSQVRLHELAKRHRSWASDTGQVWFWHSQWRCQWTGTYQTQLWCVWQLPYHTYLIQPNTLPPHLEQPARKLWAHRNTWCLRGKNLGAFTKHFHNNVHTNRQNFAVDKHIPVLAANLSELKMVDSIYFNFLSHFYFLFHLFSYFLT